MIVPKYILRNLHFLKGTVLCWKKSIKIISAFVGKEPSAKVTDEDCDFDEGSPNGKVDRVFRGSCSDGVQGNGENEGDNGATP